MHVYSKLNTSITSCVRQRVELECFCINMFINIILRTINRFGISKHCRYKKSLLQECCSLGFKLSP